MEKLGQISIFKRNIVRDLVLITIGCAIYAIGLDCFEVPYGLAAGGLSGAAIVIARVAANAGVTLPIGMMVLAMNAVLLLIVYKTGGVRYAVRTIAGVVISSVFIDVFAGLPALGDGDLLLCSVWGGILVGLGLGLTFRAGGNTGGTDIIAQLLNRKTSASVGMMSMAADAVIILCSAPVFGIDAALYAAVALFVCSFTIDAVLDGFNAKRAAYIVSNEYEKIENAVLYELNRGCTEIMARGAYSKQDRPMLMVVLGRSEEALLKSIVRSVDEDAIVIISKVHEAFGEGFASISQ